MEPMTKEQMAELGRELEFGAFCLRNEEGIASAGNQRLYRDAVRRAIASNDSNALAELLTMAGEMVW